VSSENLFEKLMGVFLNFASGSVMVTSFDPVAAGWRMEPTEGETRF